jgi:ketosteroid isomerase-like protein
MNHGVRMLGVVMLAVGTRVAAQAPASTTLLDISPSPPSALRDTIAAADSALFTAFNQRDLTKVMSFFAPDLEFYQDNEGVANYDQTMRDFGQMFGQPAAVRRNLVAGSLEVYPIKNFGAMELGRHQFCHVEGGQQECGTFTFVHIWRRTARGWQISRVVSYGHDQR